MVESGFEGGRSPFLERRNQLCQQLRVLLHPLDRLSRHRHLLGQRLGGIDFGELFQKLLDLGGGFGKIALARVMVDDIARVIATRNATCNTRPRKIKVWTARLTHRSYLSLDRVRAASQI